MKLTRKWKKILPFCSGEGLLYKITKITRDSITEKLSLPNTLIILLSFVVFHLNSKKVFIITSLKSAGKWSKQTYLNNSLYNYLTKLGVTIEMIKKVLLKIKTN